MGGEPHALQTSIFSTYEESLEYMASGLLDGELRLDTAMAAERIAERYAEIAPVELTNLRRSGHPTASDDGDVYYDRPPEQPRLSDAEIAALDAARNAINPRHYYGSYHNIRRG
jgi:hypothetical protein